MREVEESLMESRILKKNVQVERRIKMKENSENEEGDERLKKKKKRKNA